MEPNQQSRNSDDIDLGSFFSSIGRGFSRMGRSFIYFLAILRRVFFENKLFFGLVIISGLILGAAYSELLKKKFYRSTMVFGCDYLNNEILKNTIDKFNILAQEQDREGLSEVLKLDAATAKNIQRFEFQPFVSEDDVVEIEVLREQLNNVVTQKKEIIDDVIERIEIDNKNAYQISVFVYNPTIVKPLEKALMTYFSNNEYIKRRMAVSRENLKKRKAKLEQDSRKMDSLKVALYKSYYNPSASKDGQGSKVIVSNEIADPLDVFKQDQEVTKEILKLENKLYVEPDFEVVDGFTTFKEPDSAGLVEILFYSFLISWVIGYLIIGAWKFDRMLANYNLNKD